MSCHSMCFLLLVIAALLKHRFAFQSREKHIYDYRVFSKVFHQVNKVFGEEKNTSKKNVFLFYFIIKQTNIVEWRPVIFVLYFNTFIYNLIILDCFAVTYEMHGFNNWDTAGLGIILSHYSSLIHVFYCGLTFPLHPTPSPDFTICPNRQTPDDQLTVG